MACNLDFLLQAISPTASLLTCCCLVPRQDCITDAACACGVELIAEHLMSILQAAAAAQRRREWLAYYHLWHGLSGLSGLHNAVKHHMICNSHVLATRLMVANI
jgi:hypothetical protein